jgi:hypothetical protein
MSKLLSVVNFIGMAVMYGVIIGTKWIKETISRKINETVEKAFSPDQVKTMPAFRYWLDHYSEKYDIFVFPRLLSGIACLLSPFFCVDYGIIWGRYIFCGNPKSWITRKVVKMCTLGRVPDSFTIEDMYCFLLHHEVGHFESSQTLDSLPEFMESLKRITKETKGISRAEKNIYYASLPREKEADEYALSMMLDINLKEVE